MSKLNITKGDWFNDGWHVMVHRVSKHTGGIYSKILASVENAGTGEAEDNANLMTDAGNTYQKCEKLPSQLLEEKELLIDAFKKVINGNYDASYYEDLIKSLEQ